MWRQCLEAPQHSYSTLNAPVGHRNYKQETDKNKSYFLQISLSCTQSQKWVYIAHYIKKNQDFKKLKSFHF